MAFGKLIRKFKKRRNRRKKALNKLARRLSPSKKLAKKIISVDDAVRRKLKPSKKIKRKARNIFGGKRRRLRKKIQKISKRQKALLQLKKQGKPTVSKARLRAQRKRKGFWGNVKKKTTSKQRQVNQKNTTRKRTSSWFKSGKKLTKSQRLQALRNRNKKRIKLMDQVNPKNKVLANQPGQERIERAQESVRRKVFKHRKKQGQNVDDVVDIPTNPTDEDIMAVIMQNVGDEFEKNGKVAEPYKGTIEEILSPTTIKTEEIFTENQLDPALWKTFEVQVPTKEFVEVPGIDNLEKDLRIGELNWIKEDLEGQIKDINLETAELLGAVAKFFGLNTYLTGSISEWEDRAETTAEKIDRIQGGIDAAAAEFQQMYSEYRQ